MDTMILVVIAAIVAAVLIGPAVAVGACIDARKSRALAALLRVRLETVSSELGGALWHLRDAREALASKSEEILRAKRALKMTDGCFLERGKIIAELKDELKEARYEGGLLRAEIASLKTQLEAAKRRAETRRLQQVRVAGEVAMLLDQRKALIKEEARLNNRVVALETFIEEAYGPLDECEIE